MAYTGEIAALLTSVFFSITAVIFTLASRQVGAMVTNRVRLIMALIYLMLINVILFGQPLPIGAGTDRWWWLGVSGIIGLALGDMFLFRAYATIGARLGMLMLSLAPVIGAIVAWVFFGETLRFGQIAGIAVTLIGIAWVVAARPTTDAARPMTDATRPADDASQRGGQGRGILFGLLAATGQALGLVLSKQGMTGGFSPFAGNAIRMLAATAVFWAITFAQRQAGKTLQTVRAHPSALNLLALGALIGPVLGVTASLLAVQHATIGVASTLMALPPVFLLPISYFVFKERFGWQTIL
ncbi:MAG TPA: DMT family transporter, partial [Anaerolineae bacterium]|nr:DMT family transporter [Anaerolineae bacterium]